MVWPGKSWLNCVGSVLVRCDVWECVWLHFVLFRGQDFNAFASESDESFDPAKWVSPYCVDMRKHSNINTCMFTFQILPRWTRIFPSVLPTCRWRCEIVSCLILRCMCQTSDASAFFVCGVQNQIQTMMMKLQLVSRDLNATIAGNMNSALTAMPRSSGKRGIIVSSWFLPPYNMRAQIVIVCKQDAEQHQATERAVWQREGQCVGSAEAARWG